MRRSSSRRSSCSARTNSATAANRSPASPYRWPGTIRKPAQSASPNTGTSSSNAGELSGAGSEKCGSLGPLAGPNLRYARSPAKNTTSAEETASVTPVSRRRTGTSAIESAAEYAMRSQRSAAAHRPPPRTSPEARPPAPPLRRRAPDRSASSTPSGHLTLGLRFQTGVTGGDRFRDLNAALRRGPPLLNPGTVSRSRHRRGRTGRRLPRLCRGHTRSRPPRRLWLL
jgi:hypothetical protein